MAKKVATSALDSYAERFASYNPTSNWTSETHADIGFAVKGASLKGGIDVTTTSIDLELEVPFLLRPFKGKAIGVIEEEIKGWLKKAEAGEL